MRNKTSPALQCTGPPRLRWSRLVHPLSDCHQSVPELPGRFSSCGTDGCKLIIMKQTSRTPRGIRILNLLARLATQHFEAKPGAGPG